MSLTPSRPASSTSNADGLESADLRTPARSADVSQSGSAHRPAIEVAPRTGGHGEIDNMDPLLKTIQPGGGVVMSIELAWGSMRRRLLRTFRPGYVERMRTLRQGIRGSLPFEPVDSRDLKYYRNQETYWWPDSDDAFRWRDTLPFARVGLAELVLIGGFFFVSGLVLSWVWWPLGIPLLVIAALVVWFFRDPPRDIPTEHGVVVSPADGLIVQIDEIDDPEIGPAVQFGIFLSIFDVHINRSSLEGSVVAVRYRPGKFLNALRPQSAQENENLDVLLKSRERPFQLFRIRQITGQFARRIVCWARPGDLLSKGEQYGMIKLGSRTELVIPRDGSLEIEATVGQKVSAGTSRLARYRFDASGTAANGASERPTSA
jgi:phosphatidylserine decarboxylase